jgi:hypothetical protein
MGPGLDYLDMAAKLGMPVSILESARQLTGESRREVQTFLAKLQKRIEELTSEQRTLEQEKIAWEQTYDGKCCDRLTVNKSTAASRVGVVRYNNPVVMLAAMPLTASGVWLGA